MHDLIVSLRDQTPANLPPSCLMSLAFAMFGAPRYPDEEALGDPWGHLVQHNSEYPAHDFQDQHDYQWVDTSMTSAKNSSTFPDDPPCKRSRKDGKPSEMAIPLVPTQPAGPPPKHILEAAMNKNPSRALITDPSGSKATKILKWIGWVLRFGFGEIGIKVCNGWAHLQELAKAASSSRNEFGGLTTGALRSIIELDDSGRWCIAGGRVRKVPRPSRYVMEDDHPQPTHSNASLSESDVRTRDY